MKKLLLLTLCLGTMLTGCGKEEGGIITNETSVELIVLDEKFVEPDIIEEDILKEIQIEEIQIKEIME